VRSDSYVHFGDGPEYYAETGIFEGLVTVAVYWAKLHCAVWFVYVAMCSFRPYTTYISYAYGMI